jgi:hypothetical protein
LDNGLGSVFSFENGKGRVGREGKGRDKVLVLLEKPNRSVTLLVVQDSKIEL